MTEVGNNADEWLARVQSAWVQLERDLADGNYKAATAGVVEAQQDHPYTDRTQQLTNTAHPSREPGGMASMNWPMFYAVFVNYGTSRSKPYPFVPIAKRKAAEDVRFHAKRAIASFAARIGAR